MCRACSIEAGSARVSSRHKSIYLPLRRLQDAVSRDPERRLSTAWGPLDARRISRCQGEAALGNWPGAKAPIWPLWAIARPVRTFCWIQVSRLVCAQEGLVLQGEGQGLPVSGHASRMRRRGRQGVEEPRLVKCAAYGRRGR